MGNRREVDKLKGLLKQTENLVQDLQEELEMKDSLTVKELANENYESQETYDNSFHDRATNSCSLEQNIDNSTRYDGKELYYEKVKESSESMSKIEAELEAELERLGLNMNVSNMERRLSDLVEVSLYLSRHSLELFGWSNGCFICCICISLVYDCTSSCMAFFQFLF